MGLGLGFKLSRSQSSKKDAQDEDPWYIPYNGPYEPPRQSSQRSRARDSWGDPIDDEDDGLDESLGVEELRKRFGGGSHHQYAGSGDLKPVLRGRSASLASGRSVASGADPIHGGNILHQRSNQRPPVASYINLDTSGGVGESPMPNASAREPTSSSRMSVVGSIFSFNSSHRKSYTSSKTPKNGETRKPRPPKLKTNGEVPKVAVRLGPTSSSSSESQGDSPRKRLIPAPSVPVVAKTDEDDYYNSYYSTLLKGPVPEVSPEHPQFGVNPRAAPRPDSGSTVSQQGTFSSHSIHPYAFTFPRKEPGTPIQEPPHSARDPPRLAFASPPPRSTGGPATVSGVAYKQLKNTTSTPNLRSPGKPDSPKSNDRWLSARNWCDAILFPRPRLRIKEEPLDGRPIIMSPPTTPLADSHNISATGTPAPVLTSRVLAHSRSLVDLATKREPPAAPPTARPSAAEERPPRPKSFAQDDLALLRPVLSLEKVIEEGEELEKQRKQWKKQATSSLGNTRARKLSRTRSKSLTQKGRQGHRPQTSFDYLAARACLGNQNLTPVLPSRSQTTSFSDAPGALSSVGRSSQTQTRSNSISISKSKSSQSHSRGHSKNESWSHSASKPAAAPSPAPVANIELDGKLAGIEGALRRDDVRPFQGQGPTIVQPIDHPYANSPADRISPTPSGVSDIRMGIAISTPPLVEEVLDRETIRMPSHPYAQPGLVPNQARAAVPSQASAPTPVAFLNPHPYAHPYSVVAEPDDVPAFVAQPRSDDTVSPQNKMWAQLSPGVVREILPSDLRRYSPFLHEIPGGDRSSVVGVEEALKYTNHRDSPDSGLGTSESHIFIPTTTPRGVQRFASKPGDASRPHREPVRYDASQPLYAHHRGRSADLPPPPPPIFPSATDRLPVRPGLAPVSPSPAPTSGTASPDGAHSLGSPNDLDSFHDLFYKPNQNRASLEDNALHSSGSGVLTGDIALRTRRTGSGLTSLARQLSEEFEQMERERADSQYSRSSGSVRLPLGLVRRPTESSLQFVFEEGQRSASPMPEETEGDLDTTEVFKPPFAVPEDVHSSNSSFVERAMEDEDDNTRMRVGVVESVSTPPAETAARRRSYTGFLSEGPEHLPSPQSFEKHQSTLLSPATDVTRSSYMTTSTTGSRMSNLSDFPIPPTLPSHHDLTLNPSLNSRGEAENRADHPMYPHDRRFTFGVDQDAADVADSLSNPDH